MARSKSSKRWLKEHFSDPFVKQAQKEGYRSRAVFKLIELDEKYRILSPGASVIDLGAAPGAWSEYAAQRVGPKGRVVALDILPMDSLPNVTFIQGDFTEAEPLEALMNALDGEQVDCLLSDMAPNLSGIESADQARSIYLVELAIDLADEVLKPSGTLLFKIFQGKGFDEIVQNLRKRYNQVRIRKPKASRPRSPEVYIVATGRRPD
jgi:23S rRNA (uridine2552-2'-O)-methyltransferase